MSKKQKPKSKRAGFFLMVFGTLLFLGNLFMLTQ